MRSFALSRSGVALLTGALVLLVGSTGAYANCSAPLGYTTVVEGSTVKVCPWDFSGGFDCRADDQSKLGEAVMLRVDEAGDIVELARFCEEFCFVDECVPPGIFHYGLEEPYECDHSACSVDYSCTVTVEADVEGCERSPDNPGPTAYTGAIPWEDLPSCTYISYDDDWDPVDDSDTTPSGAEVAEGDSGDGGSGCSVGSGITGRLDSTWLVLVVQLAALLSGLVLVARRRRKLSPVASRDA